ncbi:DUF1857 family protein [Candidatus Bathyarchaeota archaeon]|nr:DUF1857 family protein [Candidatus Bathyarchaeota archaeon]
MVSANHVAYTAPINPIGAEPTLTREHIWPLLHRKIHRAEDFVPVAISSTRVLSTTTTPTGHRSTVREVTFREGDRRVQEECIEYEPMKEEFHMSDGSKVQNIISEGAGGELYMTFTFEWLHPELEGDAAALEERAVKERKMAALAVEGTIKVMREMVVNGRWKEEF